MGRGGGGCIEGAGGWVYMHIHSGGRRWDDRGSRHKMRGGARKKWSVVKSQGFLVRCHVHGVFGFLFSSLSCFRNSCFAKWQPAPHAAPAEMHMYVKCPRVQRTPPQKAPLEGHSQRPFALLLPAQACRVAPPPKQLRIVRYLMQAISRLDRRPFTPIFAPTPTNPTACVPFHFHFPYLRKSNTATLPVE